MLGVLTRVLKVKGASTVETYAILMARSTCVEHIPFFSFMRQNVDKKNLAKGACVEKAQ